MQVEWCKLASLTWYLISTHVIRSREKGHQQIRRFVNPMVDADEDCRNGHD
jgi:hypothetical protein